MNSSKLLVFNSSVMYIQLIINTIISLLLVRFILQALGEEDYGIYMLVGGITAMLSVFSSIMSNTSMRFLSHNLGKNDLDLSKRTFNTSLIIHILLGILVVLFLEICGWLMFEHFINIPENKVNSARWVFQFMILTTFVSIISVPYDAVINSHENLLLLSIVSVGESLHKLILSLFLLVTSYNKLIILGIGLMSVQLLSRIIKQFYSKLHYQECAIDFKKYKDKDLMKSILAFTGWDLLGNGMDIITVQLRSIFVNKFFGVSLNAATGIAQRIQGQVNQVSVGITRAITPQMNKSAGGGDNNRMVKLTILGVKYTTYLFALFAIPIIMETDFLLKIWLSEVPQYAVVFTQLCLILQLEDKFTWQISNAIRAVGNIRDYQIMSGLFSLIGVFLSYLIFYMGGAPVSIYFVSIITSAFIAILRLYFGKTIADINPWIFIRDSVFSVLFPLLLSSIISIFIIYTLDQGWFRLFFNALIYMISFSMFFIFLGIQKNERRRLISVVISIFRK